MFRRPREAGKGQGEFGEQPSARLALASLSLCILLAAFGTSSVNVALPDLARAYGVSFQAVQWIVLAYLLAGTTVVVGVGRMADMFGRRRLLLAGILVFSAGSLLCGAAPGYWPLLAGRAIQGMGAAMLMALGLAFVPALLPKSRIGRAMGLLGSMSAIGTALGPALGGLLISAGGWRALFLVNLPLALLAYCLAYRHLPADEAAASAEGRGSFDCVGMLLLGSALALYGLSMTVGDGFGLPNLALLLCAALMLFLFLRVEAATESPLVQVRMLRDPALAGGLAMSALVSAVLMTTMIVGPFYLSLAMRLDAVGVGLVLSVGPLCAAMAGVPAGMLADRWGSGRSTVAALILIAAGCLLLPATSQALGLDGYIASLALVTTGYALFQAANNGAVLGRASAHEPGIVSGLLNLSRNLGLVTGAATMGAMFALAVAAPDLAHAPPPAIIRGMTITFGLATLLVLAALAIALAAEACDRKLVLKSGA